MQPLLYQLNTKVYRIDYDAAIYLISNGTEITIKINTKIDKNDKKILPQAIANTIINQDKIIVYITNSGKKYQFVIYI